MNRSLLIYALNSSVSIYGYSEQKQLSTLILTDTFNCRIKYLSLSLCQSQKQEDILTKGVLHYPCSRISPKFYTTRICTTPMLGYIPAIQQNIIVQVWATCVYLQCGCLAIPWNRYADSSHTFFVCSSQLQGTGWHKYKNIRNRQSIFYHSTVLY